MKYDEWSLVSVASIIVRHKKTKPLQVSVVLFLPASNGVEPFSRRYSIYGLTTQVQRRILPSEYLTQRNQFQRRSRTTSLLALLYYNREIAGVHACGNISYTKHPHSTLQLGQPPLLLLLLLARVGRSAPHDARHVVSLTSVLAATTAPARGVTSEFGSRKWEWVQLYRTIKSRN